MECVSPDWFALPGLARSCILVADAPVDGPWTDNFLTSDTGGTPIDGGEKGGGHGLFVVDWMRQ